MNDAKQENPNLHESVEHFANTDIGQKRTENQDKFGSVVRENYRLFMVADGMGGAKGGAKASELAIDTISDFFNDLEEISPEAIYEAIVQANQVIFKHGLDNPNLAGMGTTIVLLLFTKDKLYIANVGDSRAYRIRDEECSQLTEDHTLVNELLKANLIKPEQAEKHPVAHMLTRSLGPTSTVEVDCFLDTPGPQTGDQYLMCSDGLYNLVNEEEIADIVNRYEADDAVERLIKLANKRGGTDNITIFLVKVNYAQEQEVDEAITSDALYNQELALIPIVFADQEKRSLDISYENVLVRRQELGIHDSDSRSSKYFLQIAGSLLLLLCIYFGFSILSPSDSSTKVIEPKPRDVVTSTQHVAPVAYDNQAYDNELSEKEYYEKRIKLAKKYLEALENEEQLTTLIASENLLEQEYKDLNQVLVRNNSEVSVLNKQLSVWFGRKKRLENAGAMVLSTELSTVSEKIKNKQKNFQEISWKYIQKIEESKHNPSNTELSDEADQLLQQRKSALMDLKLSVYAVIQEQIDKVNQTLADLVTNVTAANHKINLIQHELELIESLKQADEMTITKVQNKLLRDIESDRDKIAKIADQFSEDIS